MPLVDFELIGMLYESERRTWTYHSPFELQHCMSGQLLPLAVPHMPSLLSGCSGAGHPSPGGIQKPHDGAGYNGAAVKVADGAPLVILGTGSGLSDISVTATGAIFTVVT